VEDPSAHLPVGDRAAREVLSLPMHPYLTEAQIARIVDSLVAVPAR
jgi:UDP-2-acetamido-2-deoxy-ribo-hexuluronate aminotransferase